MRYLHIYAWLVRNSLIREMSFKANFLLWTLVELLWFLGQILFIDVLFSHIERIGDWSKWEVVALVGTHQVISQISQAFFYNNLTQLPELVRTGKLDLLLTLPIDAQFTVSLKHFGFDNLFNSFLGLGFVGYALCQLEVSWDAWRFLAYGGAVLIGVSVHYSVLFGLSLMCFWMTRAQGIVYAYFNLFNIGRYPVNVFQGGFRWFFCWIVPVILVANVPTRFLTQSVTGSGMSDWGLGPLCVGALLCLAATRTLWKYALRRYSSASS